MWRLSSCRVWFVQAVAIVKHLLEDQQDDSEVLRDLTDLLAAAPDEHMLLLSQGNCTGPF